MATFFYFLFNVFQISFTFRISMIFLKHFRIFKKLQSNMLKIIKRKIQISGKRRGGGSEKEIKKLDIKILLFI